MLSYVSLIPPLDSLILNYKKLDQWKEQKHFRVQLEAQRIYEQQLQQEQNLTRMIPAHHPNSMTVHGHMAIGSPKQIRAFSAINAGSALFNGTGGVMGGAGSGGGYEGAGNGGGGSGGGGGSLTAMFLRLFLLLDGWVIIRSLEHPCRDSSTTRSRRFSSLDTSHRVSCKDRCRTFCRQEQEQE